MKPLKLIMIAACTLWTGKLWTQTTLLYSYSASGGYAPNGNLMNYSDLITGTWSNQYDSLNRLKSATSNSGPYNGLNIQWEYDSFGNRLSQTPSGSNANLPPATTMQYTDGTNRITSSSLGIDSSSYDAAGNLGFDGLNHIAYDAENRVCAVQNANGTVTQYLYNAEGQRVAKGHSASQGGLVCPSFGDFVPTEKYNLGPSGEQVTQLDGLDVWQHTNVYANGQLIATYDQEGSQQLLHFHGSDPLGTRRVQTSASGAVELSFSNLPYGDGFASADSGQDASRHHFTGKERDAESGLDYFGDRYYASTMGRFMSPDDDSGQHADQPQSWNLYSYVMNNPLNGVDPDGHDCIDTTNLQKDGTVTVTAGTSCADHLGPNGTYIAGTVDVNSLTTDGKGSLGYNFTSYGGESGGVGVIAPNAPYEPLTSPADRAAAGMIGYGGMGMINEFGKNMLYEIGGQLVGRGIGFGVDALRAARAAKAAEALAIAERVTAHAYGKHAGEFGNITRNEFQSLVQETMANPSEVRSLSNGRTAYWSDKEQMVVIKNGAAPDRSTAFRPSGGKNYFDNLR